MNDETTHAGSSHSEPLRLADVSGTALVLGAFGTSLLRRDSTILDVNDAFCGMLGYGTEELVGRSLLDFVHPEDHALVERIHGHMREGRLDNDRTPRRYVTRHGSVLHAVAGVTAVRAPDGELLAIIKQIQDISARVHAEMNLNSAMDRQRMIIETLADGLVVIDATGRVRVSNPSAREILGVSEDVLNGIGDLQDGLPLRILDEDGNLVSRDGYLFARTLEDGRPRMGEVLRVEAGDGVSRWIRVNAQLLDTSESEPRAVVVSFSDISALKLRERDLAHRALHDPLTDLPNRRYFLEHLAAAMERREAGTGGAGAPSSHDAVLYIDLDGFKRVNDRYGHATGDRLLVEASRRMVGAVSSKDVVARLAGDEFAAFLNGVGTSGRAGAVAHRLVDVLGRPFTIDGITIRVGASVGLTPVRSDDTDPKDVLDRADISLRHAKEQGKSRFVEYSTTVDEAARQVIHLERDLPHALERGELALRYAPIGALDGGEPVIAKVGLGWNHPRYGSVDPAMVQRVARETGLAENLYAWTLTEVVDELSRSPELRIPLAVSVTPQQVFGEGHERLCDLLAESGLDPARLIISVHAHDDVEWPGLAGATRSCAELGVGLMLEHSGEGRTPARRGKELPYHWVTVHPSAIDRALSDELSRRMTLSLFTSVTQSGLKLVAEGRPSDSHSIDDLRSVGFTHILGEPLARDDLTTAGRPHLA